MLLSLLFFLFSIHHTQSQDCSELLETQCHNALHEGEQCYWHCEKFECIGGSPADPQHICGEMCNPTDCRNKGGCCWDEGKCQDRNDVENPQLCPLPDTQTSTGTDSTSTGTDSTSTNSNTGTDSTNTGTDTSTGTDSTSTNTDTGTESTNTGSGTATGTDTTSTTESTNTGGDGTTTSGDGTTSTNTGGDGTTSTNTGGDGTTSTNTSGDGTTSTNTGTTSGSSSTGVLSLYKCELYDNDPANCDAQAHCIYEAGNPGEEGECDEIEGDHGENGDCEVYVTPETCKGKIHEGQVCRWSCTALDCEESNADDMEHICDQHCSLETCGGDSGCAWDSSEAKCVQLSDFMDGAYIGTGVTGTATSTSTGTGSSGDTGVITDTSGTNTETSGTETSGTNTETSGTETSGTETSGTETSGTETSGTETSGTNTETSGTNSGDTGAGDTGATAGTGVNTGAGAGAGSIVLGISDCEEYLTAESCNGQQHEGKACYWDPAGFECDEAAPGDPEHYCPTLQGETACDSAAMCGWAQPTAQCLAIDDYEPDCEMYLLAENCNGKMHEGKICYWNNMECDEMDPADAVGLCFTAGDQTDCTSRGCDWNADSESCGSGAGGNVGANTDCETYLTAQDCADKMHDGKPCFWKAEKGDCEEGEFGDPEKICGQFGSLVDCPQGCQWMENKCQPPSYSLRKSNPHSSVEKHDWNYYAWFGVFIFANVMLGAICALFVRRVLCNKRRQTDESYVSLDNLEENMA